MSAEGLALISGIVLSLVFSYVPGLEGWFDALEGTSKRLIMLGLLALTAVGVFGVACLGWFNTGVTCNQAGAVVLVEAFFVAMVANQSAYLISPK